MRKLYIQRYTDNQRINHWLVVLLFGLAGFSGLALFHPNLFPLTGIFGGPQWTRIVHPYFGIGVFIAFLFMFFALARANLFNRNDVEWMKKSGDMLAGRKANMPPAARFNAGQKGVFWVMAICMLLLLLTGVLFWQQWFANSVPIPLQRVALVVHALSAFAISLVVVMHIYAALWVKGTVRAMTQGTVSAGWAKQNHYLWYKKVTGEGADKR